VNAIADLNRGFDQEIIPAKSDSAFFHAPPRKVTASKY
jgi:hypothetical protein